MAAASLLEFHPPCLAFFCYVPRQRKDCCHLQPSHHWLIYSFQTKDRFHGIPYSKICWQDHRPQVNLTMSIWCRFYQSHLFAWSIDRFLSSGHPAVDAGPSDCVFTTLAFWSSSSGLWWWRSSACTPQARCWSYFYLFRARTRGFRPFTPVFVS